MTDMSWRSVLVDPPGWHDGGDCELRKADGSTVAAWIEIVEYVDGEGNEYPVVEYVELPGGVRVSFYDFTEYRKRKRAHVDR